MHSGNLSSVRYQIMPLFRHSNSQIATLAKLDLAHALIRRNRSFRARGNHCANISHRTLLWCDALVSCQPGGSANTVPRGAACAPFAFWISRTLGYAGAQTAIINQHPDVEDARQVVNSPLARSKAGTRSGTFTTHVIRREPKEAECAKVAHSTVGPEGFEPPTKGL